MPVCPSQNNTITTPERCRQLRALDLCDDQVCKEREEGLTSWEAISDSWTKCGEALIE